MKERERNFKAIIGIIILKKKKERKKKRKSGGGDACVCVETEKKKLNLLKEVTLILSHFRY